MNLFSISQLSQFSGIKPHTIRIWEQRYDALKPERSEGNTRYYDDKQLRRLLNIVSLIEQGHKVSQLCTMSDDALFSMIHNSVRVDSSETAEYYINQLIAAGMSFDSGHFEHILSLCFSANGIRETYKTVIHPLMNRIGLLWSSDILPTTSEHFITNIFHQKLSAAIDSLPLPDSTKKNWLLFLPENEFHELPLLYANFLIRLSGHKVIYLGSNVPIKSLKSAVIDTRPDYLLMFLIHFDVPEQVQKDIGLVNEYFTGDKIYLAGNHKLISGLNFPPKTEYLSSVVDIERILGFKEVVSNNLIT
jgi:methanogenic corrinoid protein MtbC1